MMIKHWCLTIIEQEMNNQTLSPKKVYVIKVKFPTRWIDETAEMGRVREEKREEKESEKRRPRRAKKGSKVAQHCVFQFCSCGV